MGGRALVLGGGGPTGIAWEAGVLAGLAEQGIDVRDADLVVGTSAGAVVGAQIAAGLHPEQLMEAQLAPANGERLVKPTAMGVMRLIWSLKRSKSPQEFGIRMGRIARTAVTAPEEERLAEIGRRLGEVRDWPKTRFLVPAVDADSGEPAIFDAESGVDLVHAVAAGTAAPGIRPPASIGGRTYIDGGMRSPGNVDLAAGHDRVIVIAPLTRGGGPLTGVEEQIAQLGAGTRAVLITAGPARWREITGKGLGGMLDPSRRAPAATAGKAEGIRVAAEAANVWNAPPH
ncbi:patatin-like phospholipase family protein [Microbispora hainanensis]|uniref:Patatin-like phospholipase family protein n=1 Tax=Microbispora hainanensis TaxID=568844 RepID=A0A544Y962_9ACTN|nr:patatin-like phospholipase family protein [Microbispora hainanensis]TQS13102.1 patatin-like phospholipase family protein [Microbispora hainanensis]